MACLTEALGMGLPTNAAIPVTVALAGGVSTGARVRREPSVRVGATAS